MTNISLDIETEKTSKVNLSISHLTRILFVRFSSINSNIFIDLIRFQNTKHSFKKISDVILQECVAPTLFYYSSKLV